MSYARWSGDSDVYVYLDVAGGVTCCGCRMLPFPESKHLYSDGEVVWHFYEHMKRDHKVPEEMVPEILKDSSEDASFYKGGN